MTTILELRAFNLWGGIPAATVMEIHAEHIPTIYVLDRPEEPKRTFRLSKVDQIKSNMYRATYIQEKHRK